MGREKALLEIDGRPLWRRQRDMLIDAGAAEILLSARPDQVWARSAGGFAAVVADAMPSCGPLSGLTAGLERASHAHVAVLAVDLPAMRPTWFQSLLERCAPGVGVVGRRGEFFEPLAAVYPREIMPFAWEALVRGELSLQSLLAPAVAHGLLRERIISAPEAEWFRNWNEPGAASA